MPVLSVQSLKVNYQDKQVINDFDLSIESGEIIALFGPSGCGKTTVLKSIAGLIEQASGEIFVAGKQVLGKGINVVTEQRKVGLIFQDYALFPHLTVKENIAFGLSELTHTERSSKVKDMLSLIKMEEYIDSYPAQLSGGQQQRIAIVRALACEPEILLFDEAFSNLDPKFRFELIEDIRQLLQQHNIAALFVTHNQNEAFAFCDKIAVMQQGKIEQVDTAETLFCRPKTPFIAEFLGDGFWLDIKVENTFQLSSTLGTLNYAGEPLAEIDIGQKFRVYLRPHQLQLIQCENSGIEIKSERFIGECYEVSLNFQSTTIKVKSKTSLLNTHVELKVSSDIYTLFTPLSQK